MPVTAYIALGSNLGERADYLGQALQLLGQCPGVSVVKVSSFCETDPVGGPPGQGKYLNAAAELQTDLEPAQLLLLLLNIENKLGRVRQQHHGPRTIDLDLLLYAMERVALTEPNLTVPHPRLHERHFVLEPLAEIAPLAVHPVLGSTVQDLLRRLTSRLVGQASVPVGTDTEAGATPESPALPTPRELLGMRALVTGSTSGIGRAIAMELARGGANVLVHGRRSVTAAREVVDLLIKEGVLSQAITADLSAEAGCKHVVEAGWGCWDGLDIWVNNAGADTLIGEAAHWPFERKLAELWAVDVRATMMLSRAVGERMRQRGGGVIINMGWDQADCGMAGDSGELFGAAKGAVMAFSKSLALSLAPKVRVLCLAPGWIRTAWGEQASPAWQERVVRETPLGRWGTPEDVARTVRWLVSPGASFQTGQVIRINGGAVR